MRKCNICGLDKPIEDFTNFKYKGEIKKRSTCKKCTASRVKMWTDNNKDKRESYIIAYTNQHKNHINDKSKKYYAENRTKILSKNSTQEQKVKNRIYQKNKMIADPLFKLKKNTRNLINYSFTKNGYFKASKTEQILGCTYQEFKDYLESKFEHWMNWENKGLYKINTYNYGWDIDHIIPLDTAITVEDIVRLNHYTNLQPLCSKVNRDIKKANII